MCVCKHKVNITHTIIGDYDVYHIACQGPILLARSVITIANDTIQTPLFRSIREDCLVTVVSKMFEAGKGVQTLSMRNRGEYIGSVSLEGNFTTHKNTRINNMWSIDIDGDKMYPCAELLDRCSLFRANHSSVLANVELVIDDTAVNFKAIRDLHVGDELFLNYGSEFIEAEFLCDVIVDVALDWNNRVSASYHIASLSDYGGDLTGPELEGIDEMAAPLYAL